MVNRAVYRLADMYCTPQAYQEDAGPNHVLYPGYHELAYLHPNRFTPNPEILDKYKIGEEPLFFLRFVAWESIHDVGESGLSLSLKREVLRRLSERGQVVISSEAPLPEEFEAYRLKIDPEIAGMLPCTTVVYESPEDGLVHVHHVSATKAIRDLGLVSSDSKDSLDQLVKLTGEKMQVVWKNIKTYAK